jgi:hypothetical protein
LEFLFNELRQSFQDVRQKLVEEGWFGRVTTAKPVVEVQPDHADVAPSNSPSAREILDERRPSFDDQWSPTDRFESAIDHVPDDQFNFDR